MKPLRHALLALALIATPGEATIPTDDTIGGHLEATIDDRTVIFPALRSEIEADVQGDLATVTIVQTFVNPSDQPMHATYLFPLGKDAAVYEMTMEIGDEIVRAVIQRSEEAKKTFTKAKKAGKAASLLVQHRPNMFTQNIANLMPGLPIRVTLRYVQTVPKVDGDYELVIPLIVGPRFQPTDAGGNVSRWNLLNPPTTGGGAIGTESKQAFGTWEVESLPAYPPVVGLEIPDEIDSERIAISIRIDGGMPIRQVESRTHNLTVAQPTPEIVNVILAEGMTIDNQDFVLRYGLGGERNQAGILAHRDRRGGFFSLLIEPPVEPTDAQISAREMVFVLDCSGSMAGTPMEASKAFMRQVLHTLRTNDTFRIIRFSDRATEFTTRPLAATSPNIAAAIRYTDQLRGSGGTMMTSGIEQALLPPVPADSIRLVTFMTDGYIGNEHTVLRLIDNNIGDARLFAFGVGTSVNRYLLSEMGRVGRGFTRFMDPTEDVEEVAHELAGHLQSPVLTDIEIDWGGLETSEVSPNPVPDLFAGGSIRIQGRYENPGTYEVTVRGNVAGLPAALPLRIELPEESEQGDAVALVWARSTIRESMRQIASPRRFSGKNNAERLFDENALKERVIQLGLDFSLITQWTSFVAVSERVYNQHPEDTEVHPVPLPQVKGVSALAYGNSALAKAPGKMVAQATPEPATVLGITLVALTMATLLFTERRRELRLRK